MIAIRLRCKNDRNGNPRNAILGISETGEVVAAIKYQFEGWEGAVKMLREKIAPRDDLDQNIKTACAIEVSPSELKSWLEFGK